VLRKLASPLGLSSETADNCRCRWPGIEGLRESLGNRDGGLFCIRLDIADGAFGKYIELKTEGLRLTYALFVVE
jgi:hypothetical protein